MIVVHRYQKISIDLLTEKEEIGMTLRVIPTKQLERYSDLLPYEQNTPRPTPPRLAARGELIFSTLDNIHAAAADQLCVVHQRAIRYLRESKELYTLVITALIRSSLMLQVST